jgi:PAS domain S-box-containing protein
MDSTHPPITEGLLPVVLGTVAAPIVVLDRDARVHLFNDAAEGVSGYSRDEVVERHVWFLLHSDDRARAEALFGELINGGRESLVGEELAWMTRDRERRSMAWSTATIRGESEGEVWVVCTGLDLTELHRLEDRTRDLLAEDALRQAREDALQSSEAKFSSIVEMASDAIVSVNSRHRITLFNRGAEGIFGWTASEVLGQPLTILLPPGARDVHSEHIRGFGLSGERSRTMGQRKEISGLRKDGEQFPAEASIIKTEVEGERYFTVVLRDVSKQHRESCAQRFLLEAGEALAGSLDLDETVTSLGDTVVGFLADYCIIDLVGPEGRPERHRVAHGPGMDPAPARILEDIHLERSRPHLIYHVLQTGEPELVRHVTPEHLATIAQGEAHLRALEGLNAVSLMCVPLRARGRLVGALLLVASNGRRPYDADDLEVAREVGDRAGLAVDNAQLYQDARSALHARDDVLGVVSHDLGNPLQAIFIGLEALERARGQAPGSNAPRGGSEYYLSAIRRSAELMQRLIHELLEVRRMEEGHLALEPRRRALQPLVREALQLIEPLARVKSVELLNEIDDETSPVVTVDGDRILQVLSNLVGNAVKHTPEGGQVSIRASLQPDQVEISVQDTGPGIPPEHLDQIFERFWRAEKTGGKGIGLGLAIARGIVRAHGGRVWAESEVGRGSTFRFTIPRPDEPQTGTNGS